MPAPYTSASPMIWQFPGSSLAKTVVAVTCVQREDRRIKVGKKRPLRFLQVNMMASAMSCNRYDNDDDGDDEQM